MARIPAGSLGRKLIFFTLASVFVVADLIHREAAFRSQLFERNTFPRILPEVFTRSGDRSAILLIQGLVVVRLHHHFEELHDGRHLMGAELVDQFPCVLSGFECVSGH